MVSFKVGDRVDCRIKAGNIVSCYGDFDSIFTFEIVATDDEGYYLYVPHHVYLQGGSLADAARCRRLNIDPCFIDEKITYITEAQVARLVYKLDGLKCDNCKEFVVMAQPNQPGGAFLCYSCRFNPYR